MCNFTVAVNKRTSQQQRQEGKQPEADFFRIAAWGNLAQNCHKFLSKGKLVAVKGSVSVQTYTSQDGSTRANMNVFAEDVEFLSPKGDGQAVQNSAPAVPAEPAPTTGGFSAVETDELPF